MALHDVLSALREIILLQPVLPASVQEREVVLRRSFTELSHAECLDLAKVAPANFKKYSTSILGGEWSIIETHLPRSVAALREIWPTVFGGELEGRALISELQKIAPWHGARTEGLLRSFQSFVAIKKLEHHAGILHSHAPYLLDLMELEITTLQVRRAREVSPDTVLSLTPLVLSESLTLEDILEATFLVPSALATRAFQWRVLPGAQTDERKQFCAVCVRDSECRVRWYEVSLQEAALLYPGRLCSGEEYAAQFLRAHEGSFLNEREASEAFLRFVVKMHAIGALDLKVSSRASVINNSEITGVAV